MLRLAVARGSRASRVAHVVNALDRWVDLPLSLRPVRDPDDPLLAYYPRILGRAGAGAG
jgi:hypothetical protein